jgi:hypothetical protein
MVWRLAAGEGYGLSSPSSAMVLHAMANSTIRSSIEPAAPLSRVLS